MKEFKDRVAVITGAASGIGRALAERCAREGMIVVLADVEESVLIQTESEMKAAGANVLPVVTDVSQVSDVESLAQKTLDTYGAIHLLCNNAGVAAGSTVWESTINDWKWVLGVNLLGVIYGLRTFVPIMLEQNVEAHIVNTASVAGLISFHNSATYHVTKHSVTAISEKLHYDLIDNGGKVRVSVLCPGWVNTNIMDSWRNRPVELENDPEDNVMTPEREAKLEEYRQACETGMSPENVADYVFQAIRDERFYIFTHPEFSPFIKARTDAILQGSNPMTQEKLKELVED